MHSLLFEKNWESMDTHRDRIQCRRCRNSGLDPAETEDLLKLSSDYVEGINLDTVRRDKPAER